MAGATGNLAPEVCAVRDLTEVEGCRLLIVDTNEVNERGGREVEFGYAIKSEKWIWVVGPKRNVFHYMPGVRHFRDWLDVLDALGGAKDNGQHDADRSFAGSALGGVGVEDDHRSEGVGAAGG